MASSNTEKSNHGFTYDAEAPPPQYAESGNIADRDNLPSYEAASSPQEPPPSYESLYGRVKAARNESTGVVSFMKAFLIIILSTIGFTIVIGIFMAIPLSMLVMGAIHLDDCKAEPMIPIYLLVAGCFGVAMNIFSIIQRCRKTEEERQEDRKNINPFESLVNCFLFAWFIAGCVYIYRTGNKFQSDDKNKENYCDNSLYWFAFWINTSVYIIMALSCCCVFCVGCLAACFGKSE